MRRRDFIAGVVGAVALRPLAVRAQPADRTRRLGVLMGWSSSDPQYHARFDALVEGLAALGWTEGRNIQIDIHWTEGSAQRAQALAKMLLEQPPDVLLAATTPCAAALKRQTSPIPIVFAVVSDPVGAGFVTSLAHPGGNMTGFINIEAAMGGKWLELLKEAAPRLRRVTSMFNPRTAPGKGAFFQAAFEAAASALAIDAATAQVHSEAEIETAIAAIGQDHGGLVVMSDSFTNVHRAAVIAATLRHKVPFISDLANATREGALIAYGPDYLDIFRRASGYVDRVLRGARPADLPVEVPTKYELAINTKTAAALGLTLPTSLIARADEVIE
jgi:putative tryptophan/tyrosine transport system substrate-binding protein